MLREGSVGSLAAVTGGEVYDIVLLMGVLMYLPASPPVIAELAARVAPGGFTRPRGTHHDLRALASGGPPGLAGRTRRVRRA